MIRTRFSPASLPPTVETDLRSLCNEARGNILKMTTLAASGHPGGSMSSLEIFALLWTQANVSPSEPLMYGRDRIVVSHGHTSPAVYSVLGALGFFDLNEALVSFRLAGSDFEGHIERHLPGVEFTTGNLGQGLSAAIGMLIADRANGIDNHVWVIAGDGENQKGQISEARRFAAKYHLDNLTYIVDLNHLQISGNTAEIMPVDLKAEFESSGWDVTETDGHDLFALYKALRPSGSDTRPKLVLAKTVMGKGVSFMENDPGFHGRPLTTDELKTALEELNIQNNLDELAAERKNFSADTANKHRVHRFSPTLATHGEQIVYGVEQTIDNRGAWGKTLLSIAEANQENLPVVFDCDLAGSVKTSGFAERYPEHFFQTGIMEHHTAAMAGACSLDRVTFWSDFGVFAAAETFNQHRLNDINDTNLNVVATHCGLDAGQDGKTHQCIRYVGLMRSLPGYRLIVPADPNQTDRAVRHAAVTPGNYFIAVGRSKAKVITKNDGSVFFDGNYEFRYGEADSFRSGDDIAILAMGSVCWNAIEAARILESRGLSVNVTGISCPAAIPETLTKQLLTFRHLFTVEDHDTATGLGAALATAVSEHGNTPPITRMGVSGYGLSGTAEALYRSQGLQPDQIAGTIAATLGI